MKMRKKNRFISIQMVKKSRFVLVVEKTSMAILFVVAVIVSFLDQFGTMVFSDKPPMMCDLMEWVSNTDEGEKNKFSLKT